MRHKQSISFIHRVVSLLLAIYLFNFSIDCRDAQPDSVAEDLSYNDIESVLEFSLECLMGIENAVKEQDEHDQEDGGAFEFKKVFFETSLPKISQESNREHLDKIYLTSHAFEAIVPCSQEINSPPPEA